MEQIHVDTRTMARRAIAQGLMDACGAQKGMSFAHLQDWCLENVAILDFDGEVMDASHWEEELRDMLHDPRLTIEIEALGEKYVDVFEGGEWEAHVVVFGGQDADGNPDEWDDGMRTEIEEALAMGRRSGSMVIDRVLVAWRVV